ncbi:hypothetical protein ABL78_1136 [Leptomonas seymouri]|uniref:Transmembrane protein n=1 Tax=Leptomonas seymouri TaxID=5684 RepID=A0A0N0P8B6_LEPSE|nr:hypothetical protein ABL78_1136 [Leptomonas seymouri]|eukprot:KPI89756.1 hypothetical protein ABL78_1136 [Leptomonas seymouri]
MRVASSRLCRPQLSSSSSLSPSPSSRIRANTIASVNPANVSTYRPPTRSQRRGYQPLDTSHPAFGLKQAEVPSLQRQRRRLLSTDHPAFGTRTALSSSDCFEGPVFVSGFFLSVDPNFTIGGKGCMNPNAQITTRDAAGNMARVRYRCYIAYSSGVKLEVLLRTQVGWISPRVVYSHIPYVIFLGKGIDVSLPFLFHFTMVSILDERGDNTGSFLYFSGTPLLGISVGFSRIRGGKLVLNPTKVVDPHHEVSDFIGHIHYRQIGFVLVKCLGYLVCFLACVPATQRMLQYLLPDPFHRHSEKPM